MTLLLKLLVGAVACVRRSEGRITTVGISGSVTGGKRPPYQLNSNCCFHKKGFYRI